MVCLSLLPISTHLLFYLSLYLSSLLPVSVYIPSLLLHILYIFLSVSAHVYSSLLILLLLHGLCSSGLSPFLSWMVWCLLGVLLFLLPPVSVRPSHDATLLRRGSNSCSLQCNDKKNLRITMPSLSSISLQNSHFINTTSRMSRTVQQIKEPKSVHSVKKVLNTNRTKHLTYQTHDTGCYMHSVCFCVCVAESLLCLLLLNYMHTFYTAFIHNPD